MTIEINRFKLSLIVRKPVSLGFAELALSKILAAIKLVNLHHVDNRVPKF